MKLQFSESAFVPFASSVYDTAGLARLMGEIDGVKRLLFRGEEGTISQKAGTFLPAGFGAILMDIEKSGLESAGDSNQMRFLEALEEYLGALPLFKISLAFEPSVTFGQTLNNLVSRNVGRKVILDVNVDQFIISGAILEFNGKYGDYSLAKQADEVIGKTATQILKN